MGASIEKHRLKPSVVQEMQLPDDAEFLMVDHDEGVPAVWVRCDLSKDVVRFNIALVTDGSGAPFDGIYIGSIFNQISRTFIHAFAKKQS